jgi:3-hydroxyisobutyrate dehydrogenase-like beta-hydroxyacid dehydrogenase
MEIAMKIQSIGVMSPGDMGQAVAQQLKGAGFEVCTALDKRSARSKSLAQQAGLTDLRSLGGLIEKCDVILSIMNPGAALEFAAEFAAALSASKRKPMFVDCNAIAPQTLHVINEKISDAGGVCTDASIIGPPPRGNAKIWLYVSGPAARELEQLATPQITVRVLSDRHGDASAIKMCYGGMNKGMIALVLELLIAARRLGVEDALITQLKETHADVYDRAIRSLPVMPPKAYRWVPEMLQIAQCFEGTGMTPRIFEGAADMYEFIAKTALGRETPENRDKARTGNDVVRSLADER